jgi:pentatricopeptide repeat protein
MSSFAETISYVRHFPYQHVVYFTGFSVSLFAIIEVAVFVLSEMSVSTSQKEFMILLLLVFCFSLGLANSKEWTLDAKCAKTPEYRKTRWTKDVASEGGCQARWQGQKLHPPARDAVRGSASHGHGVSTDVETSMGSSDVSRTPRNRRVNYHWVDKSDSDAWMIADAEREGYAFDVSNYSAILAACARQSHAAVAIKLFKYMLEAGVVCDQQMVKNGMANRFFKLVAEGLDDKCMQENSVELIEAIGSHGLVPTFLVQNRLICAWRSKPPQHVLQSFMALREQGVRLSPTVYRCIMAAHERTEPHLTLDLYDEMLTRGIKVDRVGLNAALCACSHLGRTSQAMELFETMPRHTLVPNGKTYGALIRVHTAADQANEAVDLFESMRAASIEPNRFAFDDAIRCYVRVERLGRAVSLYTEMVQSNALPCNSTGQYLSRACQKQGWTKIAHRILQDRAGSTASHARLEPPLELEDAIYYD